MQYRSLWGAMAIQDSHRLRGQLGGRGFRRLRTGQSASRQTASTQRDGLAAAPEIVSSQDVRASLRTRGPAYSVLQECLALQKEAAPRGHAARVFGRSPLQVDARSAYRGALGELVVAHVLEQLGVDWTVLNAVPIGQVQNSGLSTGDTETDHVLLGPGGIFTITIKNHSGKKIRLEGGLFRVDGIKFDYMRSAAREADRAAKMLGAVTGRPIVVTPLIVVVNPTSIIMGKKSPRVTVLTSHNLKRWLLKRPRALSDRAVNHFSMFAEERSTWRIATPTTSEVTECPPGQVRDFERLRRQVDSAHRRARLWFFVLLAATPAALPVITFFAMRLMDASLPLPAP